VSEEDVNGGRGSEMNYSLGRLQGDEEDEIGMGYGNEGWDMGVSTRMKVDL